METLQIYQSIKRTGGSGRGASYWSVPALCGRKRRLMSEHRDVDAFGESSALSVGVYYHALKEMWLKGEMPEGCVIDIDPVQDMDWGEAVRLFSWHRDIFDRRYWGEIVAVELKMPINDAHKAKVVEWVGHDESTGQCDLVVKMSSEDVARLQIDRGIELAGPGIYIIDHKTAAARKSDIDAQANYTNSIQCLKYMHMLSLAFNEPIQGMIFDVLVKHKKLRRYDECNSRSSVQTFVARPREEDRRVVASAISYGKHQREFNLANPFACYDHGRECVFLSRGLCGRF